MGRPCRSPGQGFDGGVIMTVMTINADGDDYDDDGDDAINRVS